jgi:hypothetical protein
LEFDLGERFHMDSKGGDERKKREREKAKNNLFVRLSALDFMLQ